MKCDDEQAQHMALGLAKAASVLASQGRESSLDIAKDAVEIHADALTLSTYCKIALRFFDIGGLQDSIARSQAHRLKTPELRSLIDAIRAGPLAVVDFVQRLSNHKPPSFAPTAHRVLYVLHKSLPHANDGYAMRSHGLAKALTKSGLEVVCVTRPGFPTDLLADDGKAQYSDAIAQVDGVDYQRIDGPKRTDFPPRLSDHMVHASVEYLEHAAEALIAEISRHRPACILAASNFVTALPACIAAKETGLPFVYEIRGLWEVSRAARDSQFMSSTAGRQERFLESATAEAADSVIALNTSLRDELVSRGLPFERISVAPNACDPNLFAPKARDENLASKLGLAPETPVIGYVGSFNKYEGLDDLLIACAQLRREHLDFRLLLVGSEPHDPTGAYLVTDELKHLAEREGLADWLIMPGRVPHDEVANWYSLIDIAPFPRKPELVAELVSPLKPLEAMAMAKAVVVSSVGGMKDIVRHEQTGLVFQKGSGSSLTAALRTLIADKALRDSFGSNARRWIVDQRTWPHTAKIINSVLESLLRDK
ncbi:glycosyltransferase family 4 protein [Erythrobacter rubeus]|uniref:Glycosyltransferase n=1 Tax=Erythrobacter rubeus TaxID=2760803 RepID=A0ABR8KNZ1_9SPHN|nr:glycosyltransferase family 4 protein [Erythrobacter rubeus]MBD2841042.1 glycosyltransferase [Erythrobacter rubeus]